MVLFCTCGVESPIHDVTDWACRCDAHKGREMSVGKITGFATCAGWRAVLPWARVWVAKYQPMTNPHPQRGLAQPADNPNCLWTHESGRYEQNGCVGSMRSEAVADYSSWGSWGVTGVVRTSAEHKNRRAHYCPLGARVCRAARSAHRCCTIRKENGRLH
jgi:hypothetical protein